MQVNDVSFAIPFRHHIKHQYCFHTIGEAGIDYTKAVPIIRDYFISTEDARVDTEEWKIINRNENDIHFEFSKYVKKVVKAFNHPDKIYSTNIIKFSALQYFEKELLKANQQRLSTDALESEFNSAPVKEDATKVIK